MDDSSSTQLEAPNTIDSFDFNMHQIEQTNKLLDNIESKLSDFFNKKSANSSTAMKADDKEEVRSSPTIKNHDLPMIANEELTARRIEAHLVRERSSVETTQNLAHQAVTMPSKESSGSKYTDSDLKPNQSISLEKNKVHHTQDTNYSASRFLNYEKSTNRQVTSNSGNQNMFEHMTQLENHYQSRIKILEERAEFAELESQQVRKENELLTEDLASMRDNMNKSKENFLKELSRSLQEQEEGLQRDFERVLAQKEAANDQTKQQYEKIAAKNEELYSHYEALMQEKELMVKESFNEKTEYDALCQKYHELMNVHNQMIELDFQKNIRTASQNNSLLNHQDNRNSRNSAQNEEAKDLLEMQELAMALETYRKELSNLKQNNETIRQQFNSELERIKEELSLQKEQNQEIQEKLIEQQSVNLKLRKMCQAQHQQLTSERESYCNEDAESNSAHSRHSVQKRNHLPPSRAKKERPRKDEEQLKENVNILNIQERHRKQEKREGDECLDKKNTETIDSPFTNPQIKNKLSSSSKCAPDNIIREDEAENNMLQLRSTARNRRSVGGPGSQKILSAKHKVVEGEGNFKKNRSGSLDEFEKELKKLNQLAYSEALKKPCKKTPISTAKTARDSSSANRETERPKSLPRKRAY